MPRYLCGKIIHKHEPKVCNIGCPNIACQMTWYGNLNQRLTQAKSDALVWHTWFCQVSWDWLVTWIKNYKNFYHRFFVFLDQNFLGRSEFWGPWVVVRLTADRCQNRMARFSLTHCNSSNVVTVSFMWWEVFIPHRILFWGLLMARRSEKNITVSHWAFLEFWTFSTGVCEKL